MRWCRSTSASRRKTSTSSCAWKSGKILGLAVIASEPREFTIVNIVGSIDIDKLAKLEGQFGIPRVSQKK